MLSRSHFRSFLTPVLLSSLFLTGCLSDSDAEQQQVAMPKMTVNVVELKTQAIDIQTELPARTTAIRMAEVRPQVDGIIESRLFTEGAAVKAGQQLYQIEAAPYQAVVNNAKATLQRAKADLKVTERREQRYKNLLDDNAISQQEYDEALAAFEQAKAEIAVNQAALESAEINLRYTKVNAPIDGQIGISHVTEGALVNAGQTNSLATIHQLDPIYVDISQASKEILQLRRQLMAGRVAGEEAPSVNLLLEDGSLYEHTGELQFSEVNVNQNTGSIVMRAKFPNPDGILLPGMYVRAEVEEGRMNDAILVPHKAVIFDREGRASVMLVNDNNIVEQRFINVSRSINHHWLSESGLEAGEKVIVEGLQKIAEGAEVNVDEQQQLKQSGE
ncbi:efflux RND transporter periplasmic adaptor subunit [Methylophaga sp. OBS3]|uniref:efflux RND transporter periplasmic adaptor subunit n=1 Tax=Methylophaga sp. OBS3 TaxID=2991934 RepID=UPI00225073BC|nr:efflux RND transporter periplasmic adaptor subunit [Methylophaga sp. OBS3]MCX4189869.1 efflux RND transporter periplasmic adaptor subunit [Methylophaga sp. OBS3]